MQTPSDRKNGIKEPHIKSMSNTSPRKELVIQQAASVVKLMTFSTVSNWNGIKGLELENNCKQPLKVTLF